MSTNKSNIKNLKMRVDIWNLKIRTESRNPLASETVDIALLMNDTISGLNYYIHYYRSGLKTIFLLNGVCTFLDPEKCESTENQAGVLERIPKEMSKNPPVQRHKKWQAAVGRLQYSG